MITETKCLEMLSWLHSEGLLQLQLENESGWKVLHTPLLSTRRCKLDWLYKQGLINQNTPLDIPSRFLGLGCPFSLVKWIHEHNLFEMTRWKDGVLLCDLIHTQHHERLEVMKLLHSRQLLRLSSTPIPKKYLVETLGYWLFYVPRIPSGVAQPEKVIDQVELHKLVFYIDVLGLLPIFIEMIQESLDSQVSELTTRFFATLQ